MVQNAKLFISFTAANLGPDFSPDQQAGFSRSLTKGCIKLEDTSHWNGGKFVEKVVFVKKAPQEKFKMILPFSVLNRMIVFTLHIHISNNL